MQRVTLQVLATMVIAFGGGIAAVSAEVPPTLPDAASGPAAGNPKAVPAPRVSQPPRSLTNPDKENVVIPQVSVPLKRGAPAKPVITRAGAKPNAVSGDVDDSAARCLATSSARRAECGDAAGSSGAKPPAR